MMSERQCRICGEWKQKDEHFNYKPTYRHHFWCRSCWKTYNEMKSNGEETDPWIKSEQAKWNYVFRKVNPDR